MITPLERALFEYSENRTMALRRGEEDAAEFWDRHAQQVLVYLRGVRQ